MVTEFAMNLQIGYALSSEEHRPQDLVRFAKRTEDAGFNFAVISDHYHPWTNRQGQSPFVWNVIGGISQLTQHLSVGTGVTIFWDFTGRRSRFAKKCWPRR